ncbi:MAG: PaaI family thioesterase [Candidatus Dormibacteraeota bacterium]|nr:PaaI family thioesterase [Candidatus Dormibacteraeota bacterium]
MLGTSEFLELLGCHFDEVGPTRVTGWFEVGPQHHQPFGILHGGVLSSVVETFASIGAWLAVRDSGRTAVGVANATDFLRSTTAGRLDVAATAVYQGRSQQLWDVVIARAEDGNEVARGRVRLQNVAPR